MRIVFLLVLTPLFLSAQDSLLYRHKPIHAIKVSPLHLLSFFPTIQVAYERGVSKSLAVQADLGVVVNNPANTNQEYQNKQGVKTKAELRHYFKNRSGFTEGFYSSIELHVNRITFDRSMRVTECFDPNCQNTYLREYEYTVKHQEEGISLKAGYVTYDFNNFLTDITVGWSLRDIRYIRPPGVPNPVQNWFFLNWRNETNRVVLTPLVGFRFGYRIR